MKKTTITFLAAGLLFVSGLRAQSIPEGVNHLNSGRVNSAVTNFEKLLAVNPNNVDAIYWLGQSYFDINEISSARIKAARDLYEKGLQSSNNAPILLVGLGHVELLENKTNDARQHFESALTLTRTKKGDDAGIALAVGRANVDAKTGDFNYAIEKLKALVDRGEKNPEILLQLGNAYRKANPGQGGGPAYESYNKALEISPNFAIASLRLAKLFESQKNWELVLKYLNEAVTKDPKFSEGYYELFYYYFFRAKFPEAEDQIKKYIGSKLPESEIQDEYLYSQLSWARKDFDDAVIRGEKVVSNLGDKTKPKVYRLLTDAYIKKGDTLNKRGDSVNASANYVLAKKNSDMFFLKKNPEDIILPDYENKAIILAKTGGTPDEIYNTYMSGVALDTTTDAKVGYLKKGIVYFKESKLRDKEALMLQKLIEIKPKPTINDYFDLTLAYYFSSNNAKSRDEALRMIEKFPDQVYGYDWAFKNSSQVLDTLKKDSIAVPDALKLYDFSQKDTTKFKTQYLNSVRYLAGYYINTAKDKEKALEFFAKWRDADPANAATVQGYIDQIKKVSTKPATPPAKTNATPPKTASPKPVAKTTKPKTVTKKPIIKTVVKN